MVTNIYDWDDLDNINNDLNGHYVLQNSIYSGDTGTPITSPIGSDTSPFTGVLDGNGYTIGDINISGDNDTGLFSVTENNSVIKNLTVEGNISVGDNKENVGGIVGKNRGIIENCTTDIYVDTGSTGTGGVYVGEIVGQNEGNIRYCKSTREVHNGADGVGGIAGWNNKGTVSNCHSDTVIDGGVTYVGCVVGYNAGLVDASFGTGLIHNTDEYAAPGGVVGFNGDDVQNSYFDEEASTELSDGGYPLTTSEMQGSSASTNMSNLDFSDTWTTTGGYPDLQSLSGPNYSPSWDLVNKPNEGETLEVDYTIYNSGDETGYADVSLSITNNGTTDTDSIMVAGGEESSGTLTWDTVDGDNGDYTGTISTSDGSDSFSVTIEKQFSVNINGTEIDQIYVNGDKVTGVEVNGTQL